MRISTKGRYGLKAVFELAQHYGEEPLSIRRIAEKQQISVAYLEQLFKKMRADNIVIAERGAQGGYMLSRPPCEITVGQVLRSLEGSVAPVFCAEESVDCDCSKACIECKVYRRIREGIDQVVDGITLQTMLDMKEQENDAE